MATLEAGTTPQAAANWHRHTEQSVENNLPDPCFPRNPNQAGGTGRGENPQRFATREQMIRKDQQARMHEKGNKILARCKSPTGHPAGHVP